MVSIDDRLNLIQPTFLNAVFVHNKFQLKMQSLIINGRNYSVLLIFLIYLRN